MYIDIYEIGLPLFILKLFSKIIITILMVQLLNLMTSSAHMVIEGCGGDGEGEGEGEGRDAYLHEMVMVEIVCLWRS